MFYDRFEELCKKHGISPSKAAVEAGINKSAVTYWKNNASAKPSGQIAEKLCNYFGVTMGEPYGEIRIPRLSRGFFICGRSPMLLAAPKGAYAVCRMRGDCYLLPVNGSEYSFIVL